MVIEHRLLVPSCFASQDTLGRGGGAIPGSAEEITPALNAISSLVDNVVVGQGWDLMILEVLSNLDDSMSL